MCTWHTVIAPKAERCVLQCSSCKVNKKHRKRQNVEGNLSINVETEYLCARYDVPCHFFRSLFFHRRKCRNQGQIQHFLHLLKLLLNRKKTRTIPKLCHPCNQKSKNKSGTPIITKDWAASLTSFFRPKKLVKKPKTLVKTSKHRSLQKIGLPLGGLPTNDMKNKLHLNTVETNEKREKVIGTIG